MMKFRLILLFLFILLSSCGKIAIKKPTVINLTLKADEQINPDDDGRPSPIVIKLYALESIGAFNALDFYSLYDQPEAQLKSDLLMQQEFHISPGGQQIYTYELPNNALYLGVLGAFRHIDTAQWRDTVAVPTGRSTNFIIQIFADRISIQAQ